MVVGVTPLSVCCVVVVFVVVVVVVVALLFFLFYLVYSSCSTNFPASAHHAEGLCFVKLRVVYLLKACTSSHNVALCQAH